MSRPVNADVINIFEHSDVKQNAEKTFLQQISQPPKRFHLTILLAMLWCFILFGLSPMLVVHLADPIVWFQKHQLSSLSYSFQIPIVILIAAVLGNRYGFLTIFLYLCLGFLGVPLFAGGGGLSYFSEPSMGYLLGFLGVPWVIQRVVTLAYQDKGWCRGRSLWILMAAFLGVSIVHLCGVLGIFLQGVQGLLSWASVQQWLLHLSWPGILYDFLFSFIAVALVRFFRILFWFCLY